MKRLRWMLSVVVLLAALLGWWGFTRPRELRLVGAYPLPDGEGGEYLTDYGRIAYDDTSAKAYDCYEHLLWEIRPPVHTRYSCVAASPGWHTFAFRTDIPQQLRSNVNPFSFPGDHLTCAPPSPQVTAQAEGKDQAATNTGHFDIWRDGHLLGSVAVPIPLDGKISVKPLENGTVLFFSGNEKMSRVYIVKHGHLTDTVTGPVLHGALHPLQDGSGFYAISDILRFGRITFHGKASYYTLADTNYQLAYTSRPSGFGICNELGDFQFIGNNGEFAVSSDGTIRQPNTTCLPLPQWATLTKVRAVNTRAVFIDKEQILMGSDFDSNSPIRDFIFPYVWNPCTGKHWHLPRGKYLDTAAVSVDGKYAMAERYTDPPALLKKLAPLLAKTRWAQASQPSFRLAIFTVPGHCCAATPRLPAECSVLAKDAGGKTHCYHLDLFRLSPDGHHLYALGEILCDTTGPIDDDTPVTNMQILFHFAW